MEAGNHRVEIEREEEAGPGWRFRLRIGGDTTRTLNLAWADYNLWSADGADPPHAVALAVARFLLERLPVDELPTHLDAAWARRKYPEADEQIPGLIG